MFVLIKSFKLVTGMPKNTIASLSGYIAMKLFSIVEVIKYMAKLDLKLVSIVYYCFHHEGVISLRM